MMRYWARAIWGVALTTLILPVAAQAQTQGGTENVDGDLVHAPYGQPAQTYPARPSYPSQPTYPATQANPATQTYPATPSYPSSQTYPPVPANTATPYNPAAQYPAYASGSAPATAPGTSYPAPTDPTANPAYVNAAPQNVPVSSVPSPGGGVCHTAHPGDATYHQDDLIGAAEGVFGSAAHGLAQMIQDVLKKQGEPNGYIVGREAGGAFVVGLRYGSGTLCQKNASMASPSYATAYGGGAYGASSYQGVVQTAGQPIYWTGPSIGFDAGANAAKTFVLVYNLNRVDDLFHRFGAGEGQAYLVGGFNVSYLRHNDVVLIPVRMGVGLRLGINGGYMKITRKSDWMPF